MDKQRGLRTRLADERGATAVEYGLIAALVVIASFVGMSTLGNTTINMWNDVSDATDTNTRR